MLLFAVLAIIGIQSAFADTRPVHLHGIVRDSSDATPIAGAQVVIVGTKNSQQTSSDGRFFFARLEPGSYRLGIRRIGYYDRVIEIELQRDTSITVSMVPLSIEMHRVVVEAESPLARGTEHASEQTLGQLDRHRGSTFADLIAGVPSVSLLRSGTAIAKPVIRGLHSQRVVVTTDGIQHQAQEWGLDHAPALDPFLPTSIAVVSGAASIEESYAAIGGIVRVELPELEYHAPTTASAYMLGATNNGLLALSGTLRSSDILVRNTALAFQIGAHIAGDDRAPSYVLSNTGSRRISSLLRIGYEHDQWRHEMSYSLFATEIGILAASHIGNPDDLRRAIASGTPLIVRPWTYTIGYPRQEIVHHAVQLHSTMSSSAGTIELLYGWQLNDRREYDAHNLRTSDSTTLARLLQRPAIELLLASYQLDARYRSTVAGANTTIGIHVLRQVNDRSGAVFLIPDYTILEGGIYATATTQLGSWLLSAGIRGDMHRLSARPQNRTTGAVTDTIALFSGIASHIGAEYPLGKHSRLTVNIASHWRPPQPVELYANDLHHGTAQFEIGNPTMRSERSYQLDVRFAGDAGRLSYDVSVFGNYMPRFIQLLPDSTPTVTFRGVFPTMRYAQRSATLFGGDVTLGYALTAAVRMECRASAVRGFDNATADYIPFLPADRARLALHWHPEGIRALGEPYIELAFDAVRRQTAISPTTFDYAPPPPGYVTANIELGGTLTLASTEVRFSLSVTNLFDTPYRDYLSRYRYFALDPGRNITLRLSAPFGMSHHFSDLP